MDTTNPPVSVVLPVHQAPKTIRRAIESILNQSFTNFELIIVENASDAKTRQIIAGFDDQRIKILNRQIADVAKAYNAGCQLSTGNFIARMDADDISKPERLKMQYDFLMSHPHIDIVSCLVKFKSDIALSTGFRNYTVWQNELLLSCDMEFNRFVESPIVNPTSMIRKSVIQRVGQHQSGDFPEDYDFWLRCFAMELQAHKIPSELLVWQDHPSRLTRMDQRYSEAAFHRLKSRYLAEHIQNHLKCPVRGINKKLVIWGAGKISRKFSKLLLEYDLEIHAYIDIDPKKIGRKVQGKAVFPPEYLQENPDCYVVSYVPGSAARKLINDYLESIGFVRSKDFINAA